MKIVAVKAPLELNLTKQFLLENGFPPLYAGSFWKCRFQLIDRDTALGKDLTGVLLAFKITDLVNELIRKTGIKTNATNPTFGIVLDDQTTENVAAGTGRGWFTVYFYPVAEEVAQFAPFFAKEPVTSTMVVAAYEIAVKFGDVYTQYPIFAGAIEVYKPKNTFPLA